MNNEEFLTDNCKKDKELFNSYIRGFITPAIFSSFISSNLLYSS